MYAQMNTYEASAFSLSKAMEVKNHFQYLVGDNYHGIGNIEALFICPMNKCEEFIDEYRNHKIDQLNGGVFKTDAQRREEAYEVMIMAKLSHPQMTSQFEVFKDIRTYASERHINYRF